MRENWTGHARLLAEVHSTSIAWPDSFFLFVIDKGEKSGLEQFEIPHYIYSTPQIIWGVNQNWAELMYFQIVASCSASQFN